MSEQLLLINPRKRRGARKGRTAAQKAATRKLVALNRAKRGRKSNPSPRSAVSAAPRRRRRTMSINRIVRRRRRNPAGLSGGKIFSLVMPAVKGAVGAIAVDLIWNKLPVPATVKAGNVGYLAKGAAALAFGFLGQKFLGKTAAEMAVGSLTVTAYNAIKANVGPSIGLAGMGYSGAAPAMLPPGRTPALAEYVSSRPAAYVPPPQMGEYINNY